MNISKKLAQTEQFEIEYESEKVSVYRKVCEPYASVPKGRGRSYLVSESCSEVVTDWDVTTDDAGNKYPIDEENLARLPVPFLTAILNKVAESWSGDKKKQQASATGS
jgi:hypothetical protein